MSAYDGMADVYIENLLPNRPEMTFPALKGTVGQSYTVGPTNVSGINTFQRACAISVFRTALGSSPSTAPPLTYLRACGSMNNVTFTTTVKKGSETAVSSFHSFCVVFVGAVM